MKRIFTLLFILILAVSCSSSDGDEVIDLAQMWGEYFGESFPGSEAETFLKGLADKDHSIQSFCFSCDGKEFYFTQSMLDNDSAAIYYTKRVNDKWTKPEIVSFSGVYNDTDPFIDSTNNRMYFASDRPRPGEVDPLFDFNIWVVERTDSVWGEPYLIDSLNSTEDEYYPSVANDGTIYFASSRNNSRGFWDIYKYQQSTGVTKVDTIISSKYRDEDPFISPDGKLILFTSTRPGGNGSGDIYISKKTQAGKWSAPVNLGPDVNTNEYEFYPRISRDGKFMFFTRLQGEGENFSEKKGLDALNPFDYEYVPDEGKNISYWVSVDSLKAFGK